jgi:hypothetical protein
MQRHWRHHLLEKRRIRFEATGQRALIKEAA